MVKNAGSKNKLGRLMKNMKSPNSGLISAAAPQAHKIVHSFGFIPRKLQTVPRPRIVTDNSL